MLFANILKNHMYLQEYPTALKKGIENKNTFKQP